MRIIRNFILGLAAMFITTGASAQEPAEFTMGPVFTEYGRVADVDYDMELPEDLVLRVAFDVADQADVGVLNRTLDSAARFINMHVRNGVPEDRVQVAIVVHGRAGNDLLNAEAYGSRFDGAENINLPLIAALTEHGVQIYLCGQSAAGIGIAKSELAPNVQLALSAMTAHALLQQRGYTLNPS